MFALALHDRANATQEPFSSNVAADEDDSGELPIYVEQGAVWPWKFAQSFKKKSILL